MAPFVIPVFISHQGCPYRCIFCDQHAITGKTRQEGRPVSPETVRATVEQWLKHPRKGHNGNVQVAFYGGSFTGLSMRQQAELLGAVKGFIDEGLVGSIRISTRPDYVDESIIALLKNYSVSTVELGIQSLDKDVLQASSRGHSVQQSERAVRLLKENGFAVGAQLMCGLPGDNIPRLMTTARKTVLLAPDFARIYPVLVIKGSGLEKIFNEGGYKPLTLAKAVAISCRMKSIFDQHNIRVVRMGLQPSEELSTKVVAGPYHPAFGELVLSRMLFNKTRKILSEMSSVRQRYLSIAAADESAFRGPQNVSMKRLTALGLLDEVELVFDKNQPRNTVQVY